MRETTLTDDLKNFKDHCTTWNLDKMFLVNPNPFIFKLMCDVNQFDTNSINCQFLWSHWSVIVLWISFVLFYTISKLFPLQFTPINMSLFTPFSPYMLKRAILLLTCENLLMSSQRCIPFLLFELLTFLLTRITNYCRAYIILLVGLNHKTSTRPIWM